MGLETGTYIDDLNASNPDGATDQKAEGDDHLRLIKSTILNTFPNITGALTPTHIELNYVNGVTSAIQTQIDGKQPIDSDLTAIAALANTNSNFIVGNGSAWVAESGATARASLSLGSLATKDDIVAEDLPVATAGNYIEGMPMFRLGTTIGDPTTSYTKVLEQIAPRDGTYTVRYGVRESVGSSIKIRLYHNGVAEGSEKNPTSTSWFWYSQSLAVTAGDLIQVYQNRVGSTDRGNVALVLLCAEPISNGGLYTLFDGLVQSGTGDTFWEV